MPKNDLIRKIKDFDTFAKCRRFGQINCCQRFWKVGQSPINHPIWLHWLQASNQLWIFSCHSGPFEWWFNLISSNLRLLGQQRFKPLARLLPIVVKRLHVGGLHAEGPWAMVTNVKPTRLVVGVVLSRQNNGFRL